MHKLHLNGNLTIQVIDEFYQSYQESMTKWLADGLEIDVSDIEQVDTAGLQFLLMIQRTLQQAGQTVTLKGGGIIDAAALRLGMREQLFAGGH